MTSGPPIAKVAALIGEPARALMLAALLDDRSRTAGELARVSGVTPQTASAHLAKLTHAGLVAVQHQGRHRYHRLATVEVASVLEALMTISSTSVAKQQLGPTDAELRHARSCYDHMAGEVAVRFATMAIERGWINDAGEDWALKRDGAVALEALGVPPPDASKRRPAVRPCMDWSERRPHIAGQLGANLLRTCVANGWVRTRPHSRVLTVTGEGYRVLAQPG
jgi:DNA-binding transcriptional ArsR family regulator